MAKSKPNYEDRGRRAERRVWRAWQEAESDEQARRMVAAVIAQELRQMAAWTRRQVKAELAALRKEK